MGWWRVSRPLNAAERSSYTHVRPDVLDRTRIKTLLWMPGSFQGITLGRYIYLTTPELDDGSSRLLAHELVHVQQYADIGIVRFYLRYLAYFGRGLRIQRKWMPAYRDIPAEVEARALTTEWFMRRAAGS